MPNPRIDGTTESPPPADAPAESPATPEKRQTRLSKRIYKHRARWSVRRILPWLKPGDRILDVGAGDCRVDLILAWDHKFDIVPVDVEDFNATPLELTMFDGETLPFEDDSFDVVLLLFVLHHAEDVEAVMREVARVCRRRVIVFEDINRNWFDRLMFRGFHRFLDWSQKISYPYRVWSPEQWKAFAESCGFVEHAAQPLGRQLGPVASRHIAFVWDKALKKGAVPSAGIEAKTEEATTKA